MRNANNESVGKNRMRYTSSASVFARDVMEMCNAFIGRIRIFPITIYMRHNLTMILLLWNRDGKIEIQNGTT